MSEYFVNTYKSANKCSQCKSATCKVGRRTYRMCYGHLLKARVLWQDWYAKRKASGLCHMCPKELLRIGDRVYSMCVDHLEYAREVTARRTARRREAGLCLYCDRKTVAGEIRCRFHKEANRKRIEAWGKAHPEASHDQWLKKSVLVECGYCVCPARTPLKDGYRRCEPCRERQHGYQRKVYVEGRR